jgi:hypothetical protein
LVITSPFAETKEEEQLGNRIEASRTLSSQALAGVNPYRAFQ